MIRRVLLLTAAACAVAVASGAPAFAHIDPVPSEAQAGSTLSVAFTVEHGCEGSPTVQLDMRLPEGVTNGAPDPIDGWEGSVDGNVVTFAGGSLPDDVEGTFSVTMTLPSTPDETIYFPFVQRCEVGETRWIGIPAAPGDELDEPAPAMLLTGPVATPTTSTAGDESDQSTGTTDAAPSSTVAAEAVTSAPVSADVPAALATEPILIAPGPEGDDTSDSNTGTIAFVVTVLVVLGLAVFVYSRSRAARAVR